MHGDNNKDVALRGVAAVLLWLFAGLAHAQTAGSARPVDAVPKVDAWGMPIVVKPLPEDYVAGEPLPAPTPPPEPIFFDKNGLAFDPKEQAAERPTLEEKSESEPRRLENPSLGPRKVGVEEEEGLLRRIFPFVD